MAVYNYTYKQLPNGKIDVLILSNELFAEGLQAIRITSITDGFELEFSSEINSETLDDIVLAHTGYPLTYRIWKYTGFPDSANQTIPPYESINLDLLPIYKKISKFNRGLIVAKLWSSDEDFTNLLVTEEWVYAIRPNSQRPMKRVITINWLLSDGTVGSTSEFVEMYNQQTGLKIHEKRKSDNVANIKNFIFDFLKEYDIVNGAIQSYILYERIKTQIADYIRSNEALLIQTVTNLGTASDNSITTELKENIKLITGISDNTTIDTIVADNDNYLTIQIDISVDDNYFQEFSGTLQNFIINELTIPVA